MTRRAWHIIAVALWLCTSVGVHEAWSQTSAPSSAAAAGAAQAVADGRLNLDDPKVRDRLRAAGVDPDELQKMMGPAGVAPAAGAVAAIPPTANGFPPVTPAPGTLPAFADSTAKIAAVGDSV